jgi:hypothetical protein
MLRALATTIVLLALAAEAGAACTRAATELVCALGSTTVTIGTQAIVGYDPAVDGRVSRLGFLPLESSEPPDRFRIQLQSFGGRFGLCRRFGNETYCY